MSAYIRKMALNGYVIIPEWPDLNQVISQHSRISNNLNQYARKANCKKSKERIKIMVKNKVVLKERDVWSNLANFIGEMVAKFRNTKISIE